MEARSAATVRPTDERKPSRGGMLDGRTQVARRRRELIAVYAAALGGPAALSEGQWLDVRKAAELVALSENARARAMREGTTDASELSAMIRLESTASRAVRALNISPAANQPKPTIADFIARKAAQKAAGSQSGEAA